MSLSRDDVILGRALLAWRLVDRGVLLTCAEEVRLLTAQGRPATLGQVLVQRGLLRLDHYHAIIARLQQLYLESSSTSQQVQQAVDQVPRLSHSGRYTRHFKAPQGLDESGVERAAQAWSQVARQVTASGSEIDVSGPNARSPVPQPHQSSGGHSPGGQGSGGPPRELKPPDAAIRRRLKVPPGQDRFPVGAWVVEEYLADGAWGVVYRVSHQSGDARAYAIKVLKHVEPKPEVRQRFVQEARTMAKLSHPGIVHVHDAGVQNGLVWFVMDFQPGPNLKQVLEEQQRLSVPEGVRVLSKLCDAVDYAHARSILHRDLKPENVIMSGGREPVLTDFGLAKDSQAGLNLTTEGQRIGTPFYMAPELLLDAEAASVQSEVYALGAMLYQVLTGEVPFFAKSIVGLSKLVEKSKPPQLRKLCPEAPRALEKLCTRALDKDPKQRPQTVAELRHELQAAATQG